ncbi:MAG: hypothetical protein HY587_06870 [Candidatus Omnitrophica bacterium]|nr:hypothetical protein [Candidatus Omnitrophota bacterium]
MRNGMYLNLVTIIVMIIAIHVLTPMNGYSEDAPLFHVVASADSFADAASYEGKPVTAVTDVLGAPSAAWFDPNDATLINYIYVGESTVHTFKVSKETKAVSAVLREPRSSWESGACLSYPKCPHHPAEG